MYDIKSLDTDLIFMANYYSHGGNIGDVIAKTYRFYADAVTRWKDVPEERKEKMLSALHNQYTLLLLHQITDNSD